MEEDGIKTNFVTNGWNVFVETDKYWKVTQRLIRGYGILASEGSAEITDSTPKKNHAQEKSYYFYHLNKHGDVEYITRNDSRIRNTYTYDAFGKIQTSSEQIKNRYTYNGEQYDHATGQYYLRARYYNPLVGRFTQEDVYRGDGVESVCLLWG